MSRVAKVSLNWVVFEHKTGFKLKGLGLTWLTLNQYRFETLLEGY